MSHPYAPSFVPRSPNYAFRPANNSPFSVGALSTAGQAAVSSIQTANQQGLLSPEDGAQLYKAAKDTVGGQKQWWLELGIALGAGGVMGYLLGKAF